MEKELNIAAILKEKPVGTKLWSPMIGECEFHSLRRDDISLKNDIGIYLLSQEGKYSSKGECILFPSRKMRDWSKFTWKKGDVLTCTNGSSKMYCVFYKWKNEDYTEFYCDWFITDNFQVPDRYTWCDTSNFHLANKYDTNEYFIILKNLYGGKLNLETLEIEKPEFKDGDIVHCPAGDITDEAIFIVKVEKKGVLHSYIYMSKDDMIPSENCSFSVSGCLDSLRPATDTEKQQLFDALAKEGKRWNPDTLQVEDLPKKCEFEPFQKVLVRCKDNQKWKVDFFSHYDDSCKGFPYVCVSSRKSFCIPYNDQTAHLLGTTDEWKGGEG